MLHELIQKQALELAGNSQVRNIFHKPNDFKILSLVENEKNIQSYQRHQSRGRKIGKKGDLSVSWVYLGRNRYVYAGVYMNAQDRKEVTLDGWEGADYDCQKISNDYDSLIGKLVINLKESLGQSWVRLEAQAILNEEIQSAVTSYPGHDKVLLSYLELQDAVKNPAYREAWSHVWSVYRWVNTENGKSYIGSACGEGGLLQRMEQYSSWDHGNKILSKVDPNNMQLSIIYA